MKPEHYKEFDLNSAKAGAPYAQRNGLAARIGIWDCTSLYSLVGTIMDKAGNERAAQWKSDGVNPLYVSSSLVMLPLGYCEGRPVFVGDELVDVCGTSFKIRVDAKYTRWDVYKWPRTAPVMPVFFAYSEQQKSVEYALQYYRPNIEAYWKALDEFNGSKAK